MATVTHVDWPAINSLLELQSPHHAGWLSSRLEDHQGSTLTVSAPSTPTIPTLFSDIGEQVVLQWTTHRGVCHVVGTVVAVERTPLPLWIVHANKEPALHQRRNFARLAVALPIVLVNAEGEQTRVTTMDFSEGGMSCALPPDETVLAGDRFEAFVVVDDWLFMTTAVVVRSHVNTGKAMTASFRFEGLQRRDADRVRHFIFNEQLRRRALDRSR